jgi:hypothetical protein
MTAGRGSSVGIATDGPGIQYPGGGGGHIFRTCSDRSWVPPNLVTMGTGAFHGVNRPWRGVDPPAHLAPRLKVQSSYTSTPPVGLRGLF